MTAQTTDFSNLLYYNPAGPGFNPLVSATMTGPTSIDEGATATFNVTTWGIPDGPVYWWVNGLTNITTDRIAPGLAAEATIINNRLTFTITVNANNTTATGAQAYTINFGKVQNIALQSITVTVNDTSQDQQLLVMDLDPMNYSPPIATFGDASGYSHNGTLVGTPTFTSAGTNGDGNYFTLNGTSQYITVPSLLNSNYGSVTMSLWFNSSTGVGSLITKELSYKMRLNQTGSLAVLASSTGTGWQYNSTNIVDTVTNDTWHHFAVSIGPDFVDWYLDGTRIQHEAGMGVNIHSSTRGVQIGGYDSNVPSELFTGKIGPARLYNYALSSSDISAYFNSTRDRYQVAEPYSLIFNGSSDYREVLGTPADWALGTTWTIEWWSKATTASGPGTIFTVLAQNFDGNGIDIYYQNGNLLINNGTTLTTEPTPGVWTHVSLVNNAGTTTLYYNGTSVYTGGNWNLGNSTNNLMIGKRGPGNFQYFAGKLTNIRITNTAVYTGTFNPYTQALPPTKVSGTKLLMNPTDFNTVLDLSDSSHTFGGSCGAGNDHPGATGFHTYKAATPNNGTTPGSVYFLRSEYPGIESVPVGATMTGPIFADPNSPVPITASTVWNNQLYWYVNYSPTPPGTRETAPGDTFTFTW